MMLERLMATYWVNILLGKNCWCGLHVYTSSLGPWCVGPHRLCRPPVPPAALRREGKFQCACLWSWASVSNAVGAMGASAGALNQHSTKEEYFAFQVIQADWERFKAYRQRCEDEAREAFCEDEAKYLASLPDIFAAAVKEFHTEIQNCRSPAVVQHKFLALNEEDRKSYMENFVKAVEEEEKKKKKASVASDKANDYSQSFSGSAADTKAEKEAAALMRGDADDEEEEENPYLRRPTVQVPREDALLKEAFMGWHKYMGASGCFMYIHALSREVLSMRPPDYDEDEDREAATLPDGSDSENAKDPANGLPSCVAADMPAEVERIMNEGLTVLVLDPSEEQVAKTYFTYKAMLEDVSALTIPFAKGGVKRQDVMERVRQKMVGAMKSGSTFVLYLGGTTWEHADFKKKLCKKDIFPTDSFIDSGRKLVKSSINPKYKLMFREADLEDGEAVVKDGFCLIVVSSLDPYTYEEALESTIPLGYMQPLYLRQ